MFCTQDAKLFVPHGRLCCHSHPGSSSSGDLSKSHIGLHNFKNISLTNQIQESWMVQKSSSSIENCDEELYSKDNLVVWSRSISGSSSQTLRTFTMDSLVVKALWCNFLMPADKPILRGSDNTAFCQQSCVCVIEEGRMSFFSNEGQSHTSHIPMPVKNVWPIQNGLLFERNTMPDCQNSRRLKHTPNKGQKLTTVFSLIHPLDELVPVVYKSGLANQAPISFITDTQQEIVFTSESPSIAVTFHHENKKHSVWTVRWTSAEEVDYLAGRCGGDITGYASPNTSRAYEAHKMTPKPTNSSGTLSRHTFSPSTDASHLPSLSSKISSPSFGYSHLSSPNLGSRLTALNRTRSPSIKLPTPSHSFNSPSANNQSNHPSFLKAPLLDTPEPLAPEICLAHMWTEPIISREGEPATKVFFTSDFSGQQFLCFLVGTKQHIKFIKFEESNEKNFFIFGNTSIIPAKDAVPLSSLQLMVVLDLNNILFLYSGLYKMNVIHISGLMTSPRFNQSTMDPGPTTSSRPASSMDINLDDVPISPVALEMPADGQISLQCLPVINAFNICSLRDPVENRFTIELLEGELCRVEMPEISSSSLVSLCLLALKSCLPEHIVLALFSKWYIARNSPGLAGSTAEWTHFASFLFTSLGYNDAYQLLGLEEVCNMSPKLKKRRMSEEGTDSDWLDMLKSRDVKRFKSSYCANFFASDNIESSGSDMKLSDVRPDPKAFLHPYVFHVLFNIHLIYEEVKLDSVLQSNILDLAKLLCYLSQDLGLSLYSDQYCRDHPSLFKFCNLRSPSNYFSDVKPPQYFSIQPPHIHEWIYLFLTNHNVSSFPILPGITFRTQHVILMFIMKFVKDKNEAMKYLKNINTSSDMSLMLPYFNEPDVDCSILLMALSENGMQSHLPPCLITPVIHAIHNCRKNPPKQWTEEAYKFIGREDLAMQCRSEKTEGIGRKEEIKSFLNEDPSNKSEGDGMDRLDSELLKLRFSKDLRMKEIKKLLQSSVAIKVALQQKLGVSDHEFIDEQEKYLYAISARTMALPIGRGMLTYGTYIAVPTEALPIPKLCLSGRVPPRNNIIEMTHIEIPSNLTEWPQFHNGVATGLRLMDTTKLDSTWILFNKLKSENMTNEHAGFLMGQGLTGHLSGLACLDVHDYLIKGNEMISIGLLLGMSADKRGTMDMTVTKTLSIHISALLPPSSAELDVHHNVQVASVFGIGLVYQSSAHRHLAEVLLSEIGRPPGPEMENSVDRESYSLAAGLALGNVMLAKGTELLDVSGSEMPDYLYYYMNGRKRKPMSNSYRERYKATSCQIKEGECVNTDVTAPGAIVALGLMFFNSGNTSIADWLVAPDTPSLLECMMPDLLMLRTVGYGLIMWKDVTPTDDWINKNIPKIVEECAFDRCRINENPDCNVDIELMSQAYVNIIAGGCMVIGLKFAGSANKEAFECLTAACIDYAGKYTLEQCLCLVVLCMAMVMAGTGDLTVLRICRHLRARIAQHVSYGSHMIIGMACGLLVLGGGKCTLSSKPEAVAAMLCAFFPKFPIHANDNRFHLQAFRHLYVLAIEKRMLIPCDVDTNKACYAELQLVHQDGSIENVTAPYMLPELDTLKEIKVNSPNYWHIEFKKTENWNSLKTILSGGGRLYVKQRTNLSLQSKYITKYSLEANEFLEKIFKHKGTTSTKDSYLMEFSKLFIRESEDDGFSEYTQLISKCLYNKISEMLPVQIDIYQNVAFSLKSASHPFLLWQFRILCAYYDRVEKSGREEFSSVSKEFLIAMQNSIESQLIQLLGDRDFKKSLCCYLLGKESNSSEDYINKLSSYLTWFNVPHPKILFPNGLCLHSFSSLYIILKNKGFSVASAKVLSRSLADIQKT